MTKVGEMNECPSNLDVGIFIIFLLAVLGALEIHINPRVYKIHNFPDCLEPIFGISVVDMNTLNPLLKSFYASLTSIWFASIPVLGILLALWLLGCKRTWLLRRWHCLDTSSMNFLARFHRSSSQCIEVGAP